MAITAFLAFVGHNRIRYLLKQDGNAGNSLSISSVGGVSPDLVTDSVQGPIKALALVGTQGFQQFPPGAQTAAKARALWLSDRLGADPDSNLQGGNKGDDLTATAVCKLTPRDGVGPAWTVLASVSGGQPVLNITSQAAIGDCYLDVEVLGAIGA